MKSNDFKKMAALYHHFLNVYDIHYLLKTGSIATKDCPPDFLPELIKLMNKGMLFRRLIIKYALLYVVIESYENLNLTNPEIDKLLEKRDYIQKLKLLRNSIFHFQKRPFPKKTWEFILISDSEKWINKLYFAFEKYCTRSEMFKEFVEIANLPEFQEFVIANSWL